MISYYIKTNHKSVTEVYGFYKVRHYSEIAADKYIKPKELNLDNSGLEGIDMFDSCTIMWHGWIDGTSGFKLGIEIRFTNDDEALVFKLGWQEYIVDSLFGFLT